MRLLFIIQKPQARGQELFACLLGNSLLDKGHEVLLLVLYEGDFDLPFRGKVIELHQNSSLDSWSPWNWLELAKVIRDFKPDLIQANGGDTVKWAALAGIFYSFPGKLIFNNGGIVSHYLNSPFKRSFYRFLFKRFDGAVSVSQHAAKDLKRFLPRACPQTQISIGVDQEQEFSLSQNLPYQIFIHIGGFTPEKNHKVLIAMFARYLENDPMAQLWFFGDGPLRKEMEDRVEKVSLGQIRFLGAIANPWQMVPDGSILLLPSLVEGMPAVIAEAFLARIPVIAFEVGGIPEMAFDIPSCMLVEKNDTAAFVNAMKNMVQKDPIELEGNLGTAQGIAKERFAINDIADRFIDFYKIVCG